MMDFKALLDKMASIKITDIRDMIQSWDRKTWVLIGSGAMATLIFIVFFFYPGWIKRPALKKEKMAAEVQMTRLKALTDKKPYLLKQRTEIKSLMDEFQKKLFTEDETAFLLGRISKLAQDAQVELISSKPLENIETFPDPYAQKYKKYVYQITVEGSYHRIASFVSLLESYVQYFQIQSLNIAPQVNKVGKHIADIKLMAVSHNSAVNTSIPPKEVSRAKAKKSKK